ARHTLDSSEAARLQSMWTFEAAAHAQGFARVAGVDEAGRGPLAGPVVAAAVVLVEPVAGVDDSKRLTASRREALYDALCGGGHAVGVALVDAETIDRIGIQQANYMAMARAVAALDPTPAFLLVDGFSVPGVPWPQQRIIKGDQRSLSIAAASIIAKVTRDRIMTELDAQYPVYGFAKHKGYGTRAHIEALRAFGPCPAHRRSFAPMNEAVTGAALFGVGDRGWHS
ncbi:MAG TPA: ribonuclease HII, partial [Candidatus Hydrogenedentes bacterium]|nr:ribonuclease HII [Candidatus Hydrogenedentota bacterium]